MKIKSVNEISAGTGEITKEYAEKTFKELLAFQGYGFCLGYDVEVVEHIRGQVPIGTLAVGEAILTPGDHGGEKWAEVVNVLPQGEKELFLVELGNGKSVKCTREHKMLCEDGELRPMTEIMGTPHTVACRNAGGVGPSLSRIIRVTYLGVFPVMDITVKTRAHLFYANDLIVSNCKAHAVSYSVYSAVQMWLQAHYFLEYMCVLLTHIDRAKEKKGHLILNERVEYCVKYGIPMHYPDVNVSGSKWEIETGGALRAPLKNIKGFSDRDVALIESNRPYAGLKDFLDKTKMKERKFETLLFAHAFDCWGTVEDLYNWYHNHYSEDAVKKPSGGSVDLFADVFGEDESSSSAAEVVVHFTKEDLEERCLDMNGFVIHDNLLIRYKDYYGMKLMDFIPSAKDSKYIIYKLSDILGTLEKDAKEKEFGITKWTIAEVKSIVRDIPMRNGGKLHKAVMTDGSESIELVAFGDGGFPRAFARGNVLLFPVKITYNEQRQSLGFKYDAFKAGQIDIKVLRKAEEI